MSTYYSFINYVELSVLYKSAPEHGLEIIEDEHGLVLCDEKSGVRLADTNNLIIGFTRYGRNNAFFAVEFFESLGTKVYDEHQTQICNAFDVVCNARGVDDMFKRGALYVVESFGDYHEEWQELAHSQIVKIETSNDYIGVFGTINFDEVDEDDDFMLPYDFDQKSWAKHLLESRVIIENYEGYDVDALLKTQKIFMEFYKNLEGAQ